ncbi:hypothetical protein LINPERPRIM_LOCUS37670, partial [Linum perenne]
LFTQFLFTYLFTSIPILTSIYATFPHSFRFLRLCLPTHSLIICVYMSLLCLLTHISPFSSILLIYANCYYFLLHNIAVFMFIFAYTN